MSDFLKGVEGEGRNTFILSFYQTILDIHPWCYKDCPGLGIRSIFYPFCSAGNTLTFDVVKDTGSNLTSNAYYIETLGRAPVKAHLPGSAGIATKRVGKRSVVYGTDAPKLSLFRGGQCVIRITLGWIIDRNFTPIAQ